MSKSGYHVLLSVFVPFDPSNRKDIAKQAKALEPLDEGNVLDAAALSAIGPAVVKKTSFMTTMPKHMVEAMKDVTEPPAKK